jgi:hypothetical protein
MATGLLKSFFDCAETVAATVFPAAVITFAFKSFSVVLALLTAAPEALAGIVLVAANGIMQQFNIAPAASFDATIVTSAPVLANPHVQSTNFSATLTGGATMNGPSSHLISVSMTLPAGWVVLPDRGFYNNEAKVVNPQGESRLTLQFRDDNLEGPCAPLTYKLLEEDPVALPGIAPAPVNTHAAILAELFARQPNYQQDYPFMLYVMLAGDEAVAPGPLGEDCPGRAHFRVGSVYGLMTQSLGFNSEQEVTDFLSGPNFQKLKDAMTSLKVTLIK